MIRDSILKYSIRQLFLGQHWVYSLRKQEFKLVLVLVISIYQNCASFEIFRFESNRFLLRVDTKRILKTTGSAVCILRNEKYSFYQTMPNVRGKKNLVQQHEDSVNDSHWHRTKIHLCKCALWKQLCCTSHTHLPPDNNYCYGATSEL